MEKLYMKLKYYNYDKDTIQHKNRPRTFISFKRKGKKGNETS